MNILSTNENKNLQCILVMYLSKNSFNQMQFREKLIF